MLAESLPETHALRILNSVLDTGGAHEILYLVKVAMVHAWEQVMFDLHVQTASEHGHQIVISGDVMGGEDLVNEEVLVELLMIVRSEVIYLTRDHKADREEVDGNDRKEEGLYCQAVQKERNDMDYEGVEG